MVFLQILQTDLQMQFSRAGDNMFARFFEYALHLYRLCFNVSWYTAVSPITAMIVRFRGSLRGRAQFGEIWMNERRLSGVLCKAISSPFCHSLIPQQMTYFRATILFIYLRQQLARRTPRNMHCNCTDYVSHGCILHRLVISQPMTLSFLRTT